MKTPARPALGAGWWLKRPTYFLVFVRELSAVFISAYLVLFLLLLYKLPGDPAAYQSYVEFLRSPGMIAFQLVVLAFALLHSVTWFQLTPKAMPIRLGDEPVPASLVAGPNYVILAVVTAVVISVVLL